MIRNSGPHERNLSDSSENLRAPEVLSVSCAPCKFHRGGPDGVGGDVLTCRRGGRHEAGWFRGRPAS
jgi:hypothetical protein